MSLKGKLEAFYLSGLLQLLAQGKKTGVLEVRHGQKKVNILVKDGIVAYASSSQPEFRLGRLLRAKGIVLQEDIERCLQLAAKRRQRLGKTLLEEGLISKEELKKTLRHQITEIVNSLFLWETGQFQYRDVSFSVEGEVLPQMSPMTLMLEAARRVDEWSVIRKQISSDGLIFKLSGTAPSKQEITLKKEEWRVLSLIDGNRTVRDVVDGSGLGDFAAHKSIHSLMLSGLVEKSEEAQKKKDLVDYSRIVTIYGDVFEVVYRNLAAELGKRALAMFEECRDQLSPQQKRLFKGFDPRKPVDRNVQAMLEVMRPVKDTDKGYVFLRRSFNALLHSLLRKEADLIGLPITQRTLREAEHTLGYVRQYQQESAEKATILEGIEHLMVRVRERIEDRGVKSLPDSKT